MFPYINCIIMVSFIVTHTRDDVWTAFDNDSVVNWVFSALSFEVWAWFECWATTEFSFAPPFCFCGKVPGEGEYFFYNYCILSANFEVTFGEELGYAIRKILIPNSCSVIRPYRCTANTRTHSQSVWLYWQTAQINSMQWVRPETWDDTSPGRDATLSQARTKGLLQYINFTM